MWDLLTGPLWLLVIRVGTFFEENFHLLNLTRRVLVIISLLARGTVEILVILHDNILRQQLLSLVRQQCLFVFMSLRLRASLLKPGLHLRRTGTENP